MVELEPNPKTNRYKISNDFSFDINGRTIYIPAGLEFDGASIPSAFWAFVGSPFDPDFMEAALIHDYCFITKCTGFAEANKLFKSKLKKSRVNYFRRLSMFYAVSSVGYFYWTKEDKNALDNIYNLIRFRWDRFQFEKDIKAIFYVKKFKGKYEKDG